MKKTKICFKQNGCGNPKPQPLRNFYKHPKMLDGHLNKCIVCTGVDVEERRKRLWENNPEWRRKEILRCREKDRRRYYEKQKGTVELREKRKVTWQRWKARHPEKHRAHMLVSYAIKTGKLKRPAKCQWCKKKSLRIEAHHADYSKPLEVIWLCVPCHRKETWGEP